MNINRFYKEGILVPLEMGYLYVGVAQEYKRDRLCPGVRAEYLGKLYAVYDRKVNRNYYHAGGLGQGFLKGYGAVGSSHDLVTVGLQSSLQGRCRLLVGIGNQYLFIVRHNYFSRGVVTPPPQLLTISPAGGSFPVALLLYFRQRWDPKYGFRNTSRHPSPLKTRHKHSPRSKISGTSPSLSHPRKLKQV